MNEQLTIERDPLLLGKCGNQRQKALRPTLVRSAVVHKFIYWLRGKVHRSNRQKVTKSNSEMWSDAGTVQINAKAIFYIHGNMLYAELTIIA
jgi:hypothetical protein